MKRFGWTLLSVSVAGLLCLPLAVMAQSQSANPAPAPAQKPAMQAPAPAPAQKPAMQAPAKPQKPAMKEAAMKPAGLSGKITAIEMETKTVVVEVPIKGKQMFTLAGPLAPKAMLTKGGKSAKLADFKVGEQVRVGYKSTAKGPIIENLAAK